MENIAPAKEEKPNLHKKVSGQMVFFVILSSWHIYSFLNAKVLSAGKRHGIVNLRKDINHIGKIAKVRQKEADRSL